MSTTLVTLPCKAPAMSDIGAGLYEIRYQDDSSAFRVIYVAKFEEAVYVLHAFQKKTRKTQGTQGKARAATDNQSTFIVCIAAHGRQLLEQLRYPFLYRLPHHIEVDVEIAVGHAVAHAAHAAPRHFRVRLDKLNVAIHRLRGSLTDDPKNGGWTHSPVP